MKVFSLTFQQIAEQYFKELKKEISVGTSSGEATDELSYRTSLDNFFKNVAAKIDGKTIEFTEGENKIVNGRNSLKTFKKLPDTSSIIFQSYLYKYPAGQA